MPNIWYTLVHKHITCPIWHIKTVVMLKYRYPSDEPHARQARYVSYECPIERDRKVKTKDRNPEYDGLYCKYATCPALENVPEFIQD